jgi:hypothetical protein
MNDSGSAGVRHAWLDSLGATVALACALQCVLLPFFLATLPFPLLVNFLPFLRPAILMGNYVDQYFLATATLLAAGSISWGFRVHRRYYVFLFLVVALGLLYGSKAWVDSRTQVLLVIPGALILAAGHLINRRLCRLHCSCQARELGGTASPAMPASGSA